MVSEEYTCAQKIWQELEKREFQMEKAQDNLSYAHMILRTNWTMIALDDSIRV